MHIPDSLFLCRFLICPALFSIMAHIAFPMVLILTLSWTDQTISYQIRSDLSFLLLPVPHRQDRNSSDSGTGSMRAALPSHAD